METSSSSALTEFPATSNERIAHSSATLAECSSSTTSTVPCSRLPSLLPRQASPIAGQGSIYSLTLDEFQNTFGEPSKQFGSMNMDEFLKNIWTVEESQAMAVAIGSGGDDTPANTWQHGAHRQGSISLARTLSKKTVDDVWSDIAASGGFSRGQLTSAADAAQERQVTFAEMTLEDFLVKAGVVGKDNGGHSMQSFAPFESSFDNGDSIGDKSGHNSAFFGYRDVEDEKPNIKALPMLSLSANKQQPSQTGPSPEPMQIDSLKHLSPLPRSLEWLTSHPFRSPTAASQQMHSNAQLHMMESNGANVNSAMMGIGENNHMGPEMAVAYAAAGLPHGVFSPLTIKAGSPSSPLSDGVGQMASISPLSYNIDVHPGGRKRGLDGSLEKVVERRQRRMIKNRESAARSRARKQAYTVELEAEVLQLKEENMRLRLLQEKMADVQRKQFLHVLASLGSQYAVPKAHSLRRTRTVPW